MKTAEAYEKGEHAVLLSAADIIELRLHRDTLVSAENGFNRNRPEPPAHLGIKSVQSFKRNESELNTIKARETIERILRQCGI